VFSVFPLLNFLVTSAFFSMLFGLHALWWIAFWGFANGFGRLLADDILDIWKLWRTVNDVVCEYMVSFVEDISWSVSNSNSILILFCCAYDAFEHGICS
jgi:hypothetical protein